MPAPASHLATRRYVRRGEHVVRCIAGETILVPVSSGVADLDAIYVLNEAAAVVWNHLDGQTTVADLVAAVTDEYDVTAEEAVEDVVTLLASLEGDGIVACVEAGP
jgi:hypothetical protein